MRITREQIRATADTHFYIYGDTRILDGNGGQAMASRGESNTFAIPVKYARCYNDYTSFFDDRLFDTNKQLIDTAVANIIARARGRKIVVFPKIGLGYNEMDKRAPKTFEYLCDSLAQFYV